MTYGSVSGRTRYVDATISGHRLIVHVTLDGAGKTARLGFVVADGHGHHVSSTVGVRVLPYSGGSISAHPDSMSSPRDKKYRTAVVTANDSAPSEVRPLNVWTFRWQEQCVDCGIGTIIVDGARELQIYFGPDVPAGTYHLIYTVRDQTYDSRRDAQSTLTVTVT